MRLDKERRLERRLERSDSKSIVTPSYIATLHSSFRSSQGFRGVDGGAMWCQSWSNEPAFESFVTDREVFIGRVKDSVDKSQEMVYEDVGGWSFDKDLEEEGVRARKLQQSQGEGGILEAIIKMEGKQ